jgi:hypothetical protein
MASMLGCGPNAPSHKCEMRGRLEASDARAGVSCSMDMYLKGRADRMLYFPVTTGYDFATAITFPILDPRSTWYAVFRCPGYEATSTPDFELGVGWSTCDAVSLGTSTVPVATEDPSANKAP